MTALLARHWRVIACVLAVGGAFAFGRYGAPAETRTVTLKGEVVTEVVYRERVVEKLVQVKAETVTKVAWHERVVLKDGTSIERSREDTRSATDTRLARDSDAVREGSSATVEKVETSDRTESYRPQWRLAVLGGIDLRERTWAAGVLVERRLWGPVHAGGWAIPWSRAGGVSLGVEW